MPNGTVAKTREKDPPTPEQRAKLAEMEKAGIVSRVQKAKQFVGSFFLVNRTTKKFRPITNYSDMRSRMHPPNLNLPNLFQIAESTRVGEGKM